MTSSTRETKRVVVIGGGLAGLAAATSLGAGATLLTGFLVLIGAAASAEQGHLVSPLWLAVM